MEHDDNRNSITFADSHPTAQQEHLDLELQGTSSDSETSESISEDFEEIKPAGPDKVVIVYLSSEHPKKEEPQSEKKCTDLIVNCLPVCPPAICGVLKTQVIILLVILTFGLICFLIYCFV